MEAAKVEPAIEVNPRERVDYWLKFIKAARDNKYAKRHRADATEAYKQYEKDYDDVQAYQNAAAPDKRCVYPLYWANCQTLEPAFYARTPRVITQREFEIEDDVANTMALISERVGKYHVRNSNFDDVMSSCVGDFIHAARATGQVIYETKIVKQQRRVNLTAQAAEEGAEPAYLNEAGEVHEGEVFQDEQGYFTNSEQDLADEDTQRIYIAPAGYDEILHTPSARMFSEITEMAYPFRYTRDEAKYKFSPEVLAAFPWKQKAERTRKEKNQSVDDALNPADEFMDGYEIYCKQTRFVYWVSESMPYQFLKDPQPDPTKFRDFFPSPPFIIQNKPRKHLYPRPAYIHLRPTLDQLNLMYERVFELIDSVRRRAIVDGDEDMVRLLNMGANEFVSAKSLKSIVEKGGLQNMIHFLPVQELVQAISELNALEDRFQNNASQWQGVPDILRGASDPIEALGTQKIKSTAAHDRFKVAKKAVQRLARDFIEMMVDLSLQVFSDQKIARICGYQFMSPDDQARFPAALAALRNDTERFIRIDIETDSMTFVDEGLKAAQMGQAAATAMNGVRDIVATAKEDPKLARIAMKTLLLTLEQSSDGKQFQDDIKAISKEIQDELANPPEPGPPPPDYEMLKIESNERMKQMELQQKAQGDQFAAQQEQIKEQAAAQVKIQELQVQSQKDANDAQIRVNELSFKQEELNINAQLKSRELDIQQGIATSDAQLKQFEAQLKQVQEQFQQQLAALSLQLENQAFQQSIAEKNAEERRLAMQQIIDLHAQNAQATQLQQRPEMPPLPPIHINVDAKAPTKKAARITRDALGNALIEEVETPDAG
jgi:hypothetical protein